MIQHALSVKQSLFFTDLSIRGNRSEYFLAVLGIDYSFRNYAYLDGRLAWNYTNDTHFNQAFLKGRTLIEAIQGFVVAMKTEAAGLQGVAEEISAHTAWERAGAQFLQAMFLRYLEAYLRMMPMLFMFWNVERILLRQLEHGDLYVLYGPGQAEDALRALLVSPELPYVARERQELLQIAAEIAADATLRRRFGSQSAEHLWWSLREDRVVGPRIADHARRYAFTTTACHLGEPLSPVTVIERIQGLLGSGCDPQTALDSERTRRSDLLERSEDQLGRLAEFPEIVGRAQLLRSLLFWKSQRLDVQFLADWEVRGMFSAVAARMGISYRDLVFLTLDEILQGLAADQCPVAESEVRKRQQGYHYRLVDGEVTISTVDVELAQAADGEHRAGKVYELRGEVANPGCVQGPVKIVRSLSDLPKVQRGDILVAPMTRPEMIVALERAAAFVTDEGGKLCHAAIIAREMNKPCIVGTQLATSVLADNQVVTVDADAGIVRLEERSL